MFKLTYLRCLALEKSVISIFKQCFLHKTFSSFVYSRCMQGLTYAEAEKLITDVLQIWKLVNKKGGRKFIPLSKQAKVAMENKRLLCIPIRNAY